MVEMQVAHRDDVDGAWVEPGGAQRRENGLALVPAHRPDLVAHPFPDPCLDEDASAGRLDEQAVERLEETVVLVDLAHYEAVPEDPRHRTEQGAGVAPERAGLDERDARPPAEVGRPVNGVVQCRGVASPAGDPAGVPDGLVPFGADGASAMPAPAPDVAVVASRVRRPAA